MAADVRRLSLSLFFTRRVGLHHWQEIGNLDREVEIYRRLASHFAQITFVTYGGRRDRALVERIAPIQLCDTPRNLPVALSTVYLGALCRRALKQSSVFKTNQVAGAEIGLWAKRRFGRPLIVRCGYLLSRFMDRQHGDCSRTRRAIRLERRAFRLADAGVVTTERDRRWVVETHHVPPTQLHVIPNYVDTDTFRPLPEVAKQFDLVCVAKASPQKNISALLRALRIVKEQGQPSSLLLIGTAAADPALCRYAERHALPVEFRTRVPSADLPAYLNRARVYVIPSLYEGHPKSLLEAMSCAMPCIGTSVEGIREDLTHLDTGYLAETGPESLADAVRALLSSPQLQKSLGRGARQYVREHYDVGHVLKLELDLIASLVS